jgi:3-oxoacyl-[acyl-carrier protein] reductase
VDLQLEDRSVLVTGGSRGIGRAIALGYASEGARVAVTYARDASAAADVVAEIVRGGGEASSHRLDLDQPGDVAGAVDAAIGALGGLDVLVANAVRWAQPHERGPLAAAEPDAWTSVVRANIEGTAMTVRAALPHLCRSDAGRIVLLSSIAARQGVPGTTAYAAAKASLEGLVAVLKFEVGQDGVLVNLVSPGLTLTDRNVSMLDEPTRDAVRSRAPSGRLSEPEDVARIVVFLGSPGNANVTGAYVSVSGGLE